MGKDFEDIKLIYQFKFDAVKKATSLVLKGGAFYLAITATLVGYALTQEINTELKTVALVLGVIVSLFGGIVGVVISIGILKGLKSINNLLKYNNALLHEELKVKQFIARGKKAGIIIVVCAVCTLFCFITTMLVLYY